MWYKTMNFFDGNSTRSNKKTPLLYIMLQPRLFLQFVLNAMFQYASSEFPGSN